MSVDIAEIEVDVTEDDGGIATVRAGFDREETPASVAVPATQAEAMDVGSVRLDTLHSIVDPDPLDALVDTRTSSEVRVRFPHQDHAITVSGHSFVTVAPKPNPAGTTSGNGTGR